MAEGGEDQEQKTEQPSQRRLEDAVKRGQVPTSREVYNFFSLFVFLLLISWYVPGTFERIRHILVPFLSQAEEIAADRHGLGIVLTDLTFSSMALVIVPLLAVVAFIIVSAFLQHGFVLSWEPVIPKFEKVSPMKGLGRMFSMRSLVEFIKGLLKITVVAAVCWYSVEAELSKMRMLPDYTTLAMLLFLSKLTVNLLIGVCVAMFFIALADLLYQRFEYMKGLRMSKQELKDEYKQQEGDPHIKQKLRQIRMERAKKRMMADVKQSDVVITNPTHFAVALKYEMKSMQAPKVMAKGQDHMALQIRKIAIENDVPIVENPPLARALYDTAEEGKEIPITQYKAVAEIISYVYKLKGKLPK